MAKVVVDVNVFSTEWFPELLEKLFKRKSVYVVYAELPKFKDESERVTKYLTMIKRFSAVGRVEIVQRDELSEIVNEILGLDVWQNCRACDDEHIFALIGARNVPYLFSTDRRIASCRNRIKGHVDGRCCQFSLISRKSNFDTHEAKIFSSKNL